MRIHAWVTMVVNVGLVSQNQPTVLLQKIDFIRWWKGNRIIETVDGSKEVGVYYSPYFRTRTVADKIKSVVPCWNFVEEPLVSEIQVGELEGKTFAEYYNMNPLEYERFMKHKEDKCRFWYRYPGGECPFDVNVRANLFLDKIKNRNYDVIIIISHLHFLKVLEMNLLEKDLEWYENAKSMENTEVHMIQDKSIIAKYNRERLN